MIAVFQKSYFRGGAIQMKALPTFNSHGGAGIPLSTSYSYYLSDWKNFYNRFPKKGNKLSLEFLKFVKIRIVLCH